MPYFPPEVVAEVRKIDFFMSADEAKEYGLIDAIL